MSKEQFRIYGIVTIIVAIILAIFGVTQALGYRITPKGLVKASSLEILVEKAGSKVFLNNKREAVTERDEEVVTFKNVSPGVHEVLISKEGYWPWVKRIQLEKDTTERVNTFTLRSDVEGIIIPKEDPEYAPLIAQIQAGKTPSKETPVLSSSKNAKTWVEGMAVYFQWVGDTTSAPLSLCPEKAENICKPITIFSGTDPIGSLEFYKTRDDMVIFSVSNGIFVIEAGKESIQNFQPLYKGVAVGTRFFVDTTDNLLYVKDGTLLLIINL